jgi:hypothetical protein
MRFVDDADSCHYSAPLPIIPVMLADTLVLHEIAFTPIFGGESTKTVQDLDGPFPWEHFVQNEYSQRMREAAGAVYRQDIKPYHVTQPQGASVSSAGDTHLFDQDSQRRNNRIRSLLWRDVSFAGRSGLSISDSTTVKVL